MGNIFKRKDAKGQVSYTARIRRRGCWHMTATFRESLRSVLAQLKYIKSKNALEELLCGPECFRGQGITV
jgi:hypothetical protein